MDAKDRRIAELEAEVSELKKLLKAALEKIAELERRLGLSSETSSKPPSSDGLKKKSRTVSLREKSNKNTGGQTGHVGSTLKQSKTPDHVIKYGVTHCAGCHESLENITVARTVKRQVFEIPKPKMEVTEHQVDVKVCNCGHENSGIFPDDVKAPVQYGTNLKAMAVYLSMVQFVPEKRLQQTFFDLFGIKIAKDSLAGFVRLCAKKMKPQSDEILEKLKEAEVKGLDETGGRIMAKTNWFHTICNELYTHYRHSAKRGLLLKGVTGIVVHDHWKTYFNMEGVAHGLCNAHHLRELKALRKIEKEPWAFRMTRLLKIVCRLQENSDPPIAQIETWYDQIVEDGLAFHREQPPLEGRKKRTGHNLLLRLQNYKSDVLRSLTNKLVPFTNNMSEQALRMIKVYLKIAGGFRSDEGAKNFCIIRSVVDTARKQNKNIFQTISSSITA